MVLCGIVVYVVKWLKVANSGEVTKVGKSGKKWLKVVNSGEMWGKWRKVKKSG